MFSIIRSASVVSVLGLASLMAEEATKPSAANEASPPAQPSGLSVAKPLVAGGEVSIEALQSATWLKGEPLKAFEPGKVYVFECWATWCGPCIAAIPHMNGLSKKFSEKGLRVYGMNVWEEKVERAKAFVDKKGDGMSYPVAHIPKGDPFDTEWLKRAGIKGIPHCFVVADGRLLFGALPEKLTDDVIESLLAGGSKRSQVVHAFSNLDKAEASLNEEIKGFNLAMNQKNVAGMESQLEKVEKMAPDAPGLPVMRMNLALYKGNWEVATKILETGDPMKVGRSIVMAGVNYANSNLDVAIPENFLIALVARDELILKQTTMMGPMDFVNLAYLQHRLQKPNDAVESIQKGLKIAKAQAEQGRLSAVPFERLAKAFESQEVPRLQVFYGWLRESAMPQRPAQNPRSAPTPSSQESNSPANPAKSPQ